MLKGKILERQSIIKQEFRKGLAIVQMTVTCDVVREIRG